MKHTLYPNLPLQKKRLIRKQLLDIIEMRKKQKAHYIKLCIEPIDRMITNTNQTLKGEISLEHYRVLVQRHHDYMIKCLEVGVCKEQI